MKIRIPSGAYLISFGVEGVIEGHNVLHIEGVYNGDHFMKTLVEHIKSNMDERALEVLNHCGKGIVIRNFQRIGDIVK